MVTRAHVVWHYHFRSITIFLVSYSISAALTTMVIRLPHKSDHIWALFMCCVACGLYNVYSLCLHARLHELLSILITK
jgi:hypothetical protein